MIQQSTMRSQGSLLLLLLLRLSATALIASAQEQGSTRTAGLQLASAWPTMMSTWSHNAGASIRNGIMNMNRHSPPTPIRRLSLADRTSDKYRRHKDKDEEEAPQDDSDSDSDSSATPKAVSPYEVDLSAVSDDAFSDDDEEEEDDADDTSSSHATKDVTRKTNSTSASSSNNWHTTSNTTATATATTATSTTTTIPTISQWDSPNATFDPTNRTTNNSTTSIMIPPEQAQPDSWPVIVFGIFALLAVGLCSATAVKNCQHGKRQKYDEIESLIV
jgi:hypothetical protein